MRLYLKLHCFADKYTMIVYEHKHDIELKFRSLKILDAFYIYNKYIKNFLMIKVY